MSVRPSTIFPISLYEELLPKVVAAMELTQQTEGLTSQQEKQKLLQTVELMFFNVLMALDNNTIRRMHLKMLFHKQKTSQSIYLGES